mmetsp:Transcript_36816/g.56365  ORF Transcript_36816/g.56365 Transcript_36816/m.56365 type:complete len:84 (+) Transcript_36816:406-657(+)
MKAQISFNRGALQNLQVMCEPFKSGDFKINISQGSFALLGTQNSQSFYESNHFRIMSGAAEVVTFSREVRGDEVSEIGGEFSW